MKWHCREPKWHCSRCCDSGTGLHASGKDSRRLRDWVLGGWIGLSWLVNGAGTWVLGWSIAWGDGGVSRDVFRIGSHGTCIGLALHQSQREFDSSVFGASPLGESTLYGCSARCRNAESLGILMACEDDRQVKPMCKASLIVNPTSRPTLTVSKVSHEKSRSAKLRNNLIINLVDVFLSIDSERAITSVHNCRFDASIESLIHTVVKPHCHEYLRRVYIYSFFCDPLMPDNGNLVVPSSRRSRNPASPLQVLSEVCNLFFTCRLCPGQCFEKYRIELFCCFSSWFRIRHAWEPYVSRHFTSWYPFFRSAELGIKLTLSLIAGDLLAMNFRSL